MLSDGKQEENQTLNLPLWNNYGCPAEHFGWSIPAHNMEDREER